MLAPPSVMTNAMLGASGLSSAVLNNSVLSVRNPSAMLVLPPSNAICPTALK